MRRNAGLLFWCVMGVLLVLGLAAGVLYWLFWKPDAASWGGRILGIIIWAGAVKTHLYFPFGFNVVAANVLK